EPQRTVRRRHADPRVVDEKLPTRRNGSRSEPVRYERGDVRIPERREMAPERRAEIFRKTVPPGDLRPDREDDSAHAASGEPAGTSTAWASPASTSSPAKRRRS